MSNKFEIGKACYCFRKKWELLGKKLLVEKIVVWNLECFLPFRYAHRVL